MRTICLCTLLVALVVSGCATGTGESFMRAGYDFSQLDKVAVIEVSGAVRGVAGYALSPQQAVQVQKIIRKICVELPPRVAVKK